MIDPTIRPAETGDLEQLLFLEREAREALCDQRGGERWLAENPELRWMQTLENHHVVVGLIDDVLVSVLVARVGEDHVLHVDLVWVTPMARELGFGDTMLAWAIDRGREAGAIGVEGQALPGDRHTKNLWERAGIVARLIVTYRSL